MGIEYSAKLIVGLYQDEIKIDDEDVLEDMDRAVGYYDGGPDVTIRGVEVADSGDYSAAEITLDPAKIEAAKAKFLALTGQEGKLYLALHSS
jgi:hypothetical protein